MKYGYIRVSTKEQERFIEAWISGSIKLSDCIKATGLS